MRKRLLVPVLLVIAVTAAACGGGSDEPSTNSATNSATSPGDGVVIGVKGLKFEPEDVKVKVGETVRWSWDENLAHNVEPKDAADKFGTEKKNLQKADISHVFEEPGTYEFECTLHTGMEGTVEVEE
mgnify:CR=1 FL=1